jgi:hypothetical protein
VNFGRFSHSSQLARKKDDHEEQQIENHKDSRGDPVGQCELHKADQSGCKAPFDYLRIVIVTHSLAIHIKHSHNVLLVVVVVLLSCRAFTQML